MPSTATAAPTTPRLFVCRCGQPVFFCNSECLNCGAPLGYAPRPGRVLPLEPESPGWWRAAGTRWRRCANLDTALACNWLIEQGDHDDAAQPQCRSCRLTRTIPDLSRNGSLRWWARIEGAKRRLLSSLIGLRLPVRSRTDDPLRGLAFDLLRAAPGGPPVVTGHQNGVITLDVQEADDATRETRRDALAEPYRTLLGHLRHEIGHYYWQRLVAPGAWLVPFRHVFGDERQDHARALQQHHQLGPVADWGARHVSAYAACHPWEDWAETWAHYLHMLDTLDTARSFGLEADRVEPGDERYDARVLEAPGATDAERFLSFLNDWMELTGALNELARSMGLPDFYPFVLSQAAVRKLHFVHRVVLASAAPPLSVDAQATVRRERASADDAGAPFAACGSSVNARTGRSG